MNFASCLARARGAETEEDTAMPPPKKRHIITDNEPKPKQKNIPILSFSVEDLEKIQNERAAKNATARAILTDSSFDINNDKTEQEDEEGEDLSNEIDETLETASRSVLNMRRDDSDHISGGEDGNDDGDVGAGVAFKPVGYLSDESKKRQRVQYLKQKLFPKDNRPWSCKFCSVGDGKIDGLSSWNLKAVYSMEDELKWMEEKQYIRLIVDKFNQLVSNENLMRNPDDVISDLTYEEYEIHLHLCIAPRNVKERMWSRVNSYCGEVDYIREHGLKYKHPDGRFALGHNDAKVVIAMESQIRQYLNYIDKIEVRERETKEAKRTKAKEEVARKGRAYYDK